MPGICYEVTESYAAQNRSNKHRYDMKAAVCRCMMLAQWKRLPESMSAHKNKTASASFLLLSSLMYVVAAVAFWDGDPKFMTLSEFYRRPSLITRSAICEPVSQRDHQFRAKTKGVTTFLSSWLGFFCLRQPKIAKCVSKKLKTYSFFHAQCQKNNRVYLKPRRSPLKFTKSSQKTP